MTTHSWAYQPGHPAYHQAWPTMVGDARRIIEYVRRLGIVIAGPDGLGTPVLNQQVGIGFNGDASTDLAGEPFTLLAPDCPLGHPVATGTVTTNRKPYDLAVTTILLRCALLAPEAFAVASDASWSQWGSGSATWPAAATRHSSRRIVADLFEGRPVASPLRESLAGIWFATATAEPSPPPVRRFEAGQPVHVHAYGNWRPGIVTKLGRTRVTVRYTRNGAGETAERAFPTTEVYSAEGIALVPVDQLRDGDVVVTVNAADQSVADVRHGPRRQRVVAYANAAELAVQRAQYEADLAERALAQVEPENRLVAEPWKPGGKPNSPHSPTPRPR